MFKFLFIFLILYLVFKVVRGFFKGFFIIKQIKKQHSESDASEPNPFLYSRRQGQEKDISDRARILDEDKNAE